MNKQKKAITPLWIQMEIIKNWESEIKSMNAAKDLIHICNVFPLAPGSEASYPLQLQATIHTISNSYSARNQNFSYNLSKYHKRISKLSSSLKSVDGNY